MAIWPPKLPNWPYPPVSQDSEMRLNQNATETTRQLTLEDDDDNNEEEEEEGALVVLVEQGKEVAVEAGRAPSSV